MHVARISLGLPILYFSGCSSAMAIVFILGNNAEHD